MQCVEDLYKKHGEKLGLNLIAGKKKGLKRKIKVPEAHRPGLSLAGYLKYHVGNRIIIFGKVEIEYLRDLEPSLRIQRLNTILSSQTPAIIVARNYNPPKELLLLCETMQIPLFRTPMTTMNLLSKLIHLLHEEFAPSLVCHGTFVSVFGVGLLIQGDSSVGKSEAALGLVEKGHLLISDDVVRVTKREGEYLEGKGIEVSQYLMEIRGIGIIDIATLYGEVCVREKKSLDIVVKLEVWDDSHFYDRVGIEEEFIEILNIAVPYHVLPVKPGRDVVLLLETIILNYRLKKIGYHSAKEFNDRLLMKLSQKKKSFHDNIRSLNKRSKMINR